MLHDWLATTARALPQRPALITTDVNITYAELELSVSRVAGALAAAGVSTGDHVATYLHSGVTAVVLLHALMRLRAVLVPLNTHLTEAELVWQVSNAAATVLIYTGDAPPISADGLHCLHADALLEADAAPQPPRPVDLDAPFAVVHTSGTSGRPKGALLTWGAVYHSAAASAYRLGHQPGDVWLCVLPLFHVGGLSILVRATLYGIGVELHPRFDVDAVNTALAAGRVTLISLVPTMLYRLLDASRGVRWHPHLRLVLLGGAAATSDLLVRSAAAGVPIATTYGLSEAASQVATATPESATRKPGTVGRPLMGTRVRIVDENGVDQPAGAYGEVIVSGPTLMQGYINDEAASAAALRDGWLHTGDIGFLDEDGDLFLVQRRSDLIVSGGENIYPAEVEAALRSHPAVSDVAVIGVPDSEWGQRVAAAVVLLPERRVSTDNLLAHAGERLARYKLPRLLRFVPELPQTGPGKIDRAALRALFADHGA